MELEACPGRGWPPFVGASWPCARALPATMLDVSRTQTAEEEVPLGHYGRLYLPRTPTATLPGARRSVLVPNERLSLFSPCSDLSEPVRLERRAECNDSDAVQLLKVGHKRRYGLIGALSQELGTRPQCYEEAQATWKGHRPLFQPMAPAKVSADSISLRLRPALDDPAPNPILPS